MVFNVRIFGYRGFQHMAQAQVRDAMPGAFLAEEPPLWSSIGVCNGAFPVSLTSDLPAGKDGALVLGIEVPDGCAIRYELQPLGPNAIIARKPGALSRRRTGFTYIGWNAGAAFCFVDAASFL